MAIIQYQKVKCDVCEKTVETKAEYGRIPSGWYDLEVTEWSGTSGQGRFHKEVCSVKCLKKAMHDFKRLEPREPAMIL